MPRRGSQNSCPKHLGLRPDYWPLGVAATSPGCPRLRLVTRGSHPLVSCGTGRQKLCPQQHRGGNPPKTGQPRAETDQRRAGGARQRRDPWSLRAAAAAGSLRASAHTRLPFAGPARGRTAVAPRRARAARGPPPAPARPRSRPAALRGGAPGGASATIISRQRPRSTRAAALLALLAGAARAAVETHEVHASGRCCAAST